MVLMQPSTYLGPRDNLGSLHNNFFACYNLRQGLRRRAGAPYHRSAPKLVLWLGESADEAVEVLEDVEGASARVGVRLPHLHHDGAHAVGYLCDEEMTVFIRVSRGTYNMHCSPLYYPLTLCFVLVHIRISKANGYKAIPLSCPILIGQHGNLALT